MFRFPRIRSGLVRAPAMVMALGIFLLFAGPFLLEMFVEPGTAQAVVSALTCLLGLWLAYLLFLFIDQALRDRKVLWDYTVDHFAIGTWVAGVNVFSRAIIPVNLTLARLGSLFGLALWVAYMFWLSGMVRRTELRPKLNGVSFLTAVATQSVVVSALRIWAGLPAQVPALLVVLNLLGLLFYLVHFYLVWIVRGTRAQMGNWAPPNNITHGALSITILASELLATQMTAGRGLFLLAIQAAWILDSALFFLVFLFELNLLRKRPAQLLKFQMANWARNFTYGMYFACTYYGATQFPGSVMSRVASRPLLVSLALLVCLVNFWELGHQVVTALRSPARREQRAESALREETQHG